MLTFFRVRPKLDSVYQLGSVKSIYCFCGVSFWLQGIASEAKILGKQNSQLHSLITSSCPHCILNPHYIALYHIYIGTYIVYDIF